MTTSELIGSARQLAKYRHSEELKVDTESDSIEPLRNVVFTMPRTAAEVVTLPSVSNSFLAAQTS